jgi:hypothetical protein
MLKFVALIVTTLPETVKLPVTVTSPDIVPPEAEYFVLANAYAELAYEPEVTALWSAVFAESKAAFE